MDLTEALTFVQARKQGVLVTLRANGRPQLSNIFYVPGDEGMLRISVTDDRAKTSNLRRDPRASLYVLGDNFFQYVVIEATAELTPVAADPHDATVDALVDYYKAGHGRAPGLGRVPGRHGRRQAAARACCAPSGPTGWWCRRADAPARRGGRLPRRSAYGQVVPTRLAWDRMPVSSGRGGDLGRDGRAVVEARAEGAVPRRPVRVGRPAGAAGDGDALGAGDPADR